MNQEGRNIAYVDGQNLYMGTAKSELYWKVDLARLRVYLEKKYHVIKAYYYLGYLQEEHEDFFVYLDDRDIKHKIAKEKFR